jgi:hypothetical protein
MLLGLFIVPVFLLWAGHHWRRRSAAVKGAFWGGVAGHTIAGLLASYAAMYRPELWSSENVIRGFLGFWSMLCLGVGGALIGAWLAGRRPEAGERTVRRMQ